MWILPHLLVHLVVVYGAIQLIFAGVFVAQFLLSIMDPVQSRTEDMWQMLFLVHSVAYWLTALVILVLAFVWVRTCMYVHGEVGLFNPCPDQSPHQIQNAIEWWGGAVKQSITWRRRRGEYQQLD